MRRLGFERTRSHEGNLPDPSVETPKGLPASERLIEDRLVIGHLANVSDLGGIDEDDALCLRLHVNPSLG
jgi:hypothetical protein